MNESQKGPGAPDRNIHGMVMEQTSLGSCSKIDEQIFQAPSFSFARCQEPWRRTVVMAAANASVLNATELCT